MNLRKIIREQISRILEEADVTGINSVVDDTLGNIGTQLTNDLQNVDSIIKTHQIDLKNKDSQIKTNLQLKSKLDAANPEKKGLERQIPEDQKDLERRRKQLKDLEMAQKGIVDAQSEIEKQRLELQKQTATQSNNPGEAQSDSVLPSLESPI
jgi:chromosome segregation ATPase